MTEHQAHESAREVPDSIKREVRQRCGYGCVICGLPLYEYEHMEEWAIVKRHRANEITLLCPVHHAAKTKGLLPKELVRRRNDAPYNRANGKSTPFGLYFYGNRFEAEIGGNTIKNKYRRHFTALSIDTIPLVRFVSENGMLFLSVLAFDRDNRKILEVQENELVYSTKPWDIQFVARTLTIREAPRNILLEIQFESPNRIAINRGHFYLNNVDAEVTKGDLVVNNMGCGVGGSTFIDVEYGIAIGDGFPVDTMSCGAFFSDFPR